MADKGVGRNNEPEGELAPVLVNQCGWDCGFSNMWLWIPNYVNVRSMKTTVDIPESELADAMKFTKAKTKREAIVTVITEFNRRQRMAALLKHSGVSRSFMTVDELRNLRRKR